MKPRTPWLLPVLFVLLPAVACAEQDRSNSISAVQVGFAGRYKVGVWTPVEVVLSARQRVAGTVTLTVPDCDGVPSSVSTAFAEGAKSVRLYVRFGRVDSSLVVRLQADDGSPCVRRVFTTAAEADGNHFLPAIAAERKMILTLGVDQGAVEAAVRRRGQPAQRQPLVVPLEDMGQLPEEWLAYEAVGAVVIASDRPDMFANIKPNDPRVSALDKWIRLGGRLLLSVGSRAETALGSGSPLARFAPGSYQSMVNLHQTGALETYCGSATAVPSSAGGRLDIPVPRLDNVQGVVEAREADLPLVVRTARGFGQIAFIAADLNSSPLDKWIERPLLIAHLLDVPTKVGETRAENITGMHLGYTNMAGQLRSALDHFENVRSVPFWVVGMLVVVYILLIGVGDYFFLRKVARRMQLTWITFPAIVLAVSVGAYLLAHYLKGDRAHVNQVALVDVDTVSGEVRGTSWMGLFSPRSELFDLSLRLVPPEGPVEGDSRVLLSWLGLPGSALGGMNPHATDPMVRGEPYRFSPDLDAIVGMPLATWSSKSLTARWTTSQQPYPDAELREDGQGLSGTIENTLDFPLSDCLLMYGRWVYSLGDLKPGQSVQVGPAVKRSELRTLLTGRRLVAGDSEGDYRHVLTPYDKSSVDVAYILRLMMFYEAAGGELYTGLSNGYQGFVDFSGLLKMDRAILVGAAPPKRQAAELLRDGQPIAAAEDRHVTFYRFVFPVTVGRDAPDANR